MKEKYEKLLEEHQTLRTSCNDQQTKNIELLNKQKHVDEIEQKMEKQSRLNIIMLTSRENEDRRSLQVC